MVVLMAWKSKQRIDTVPIDEVLRTSDNKAAGACSTTTASRGWRVCCVMCGFHLNVCLYLSISLSVSLSVSLSLSVCLSVSLCLFLSLTFSLSLNVSLHLPPSIYSSVQISVHLRNHQLILTASGSNLSSSSSSSSSSSAPSSSSSSSS